MPDDRCRATLNDIGTEELAHWEMLGTMIYQCMRGASYAQIDEAGMAGYYTMHSRGVFPADPNGVPFTTAYIACTGDPVADLHEDLASDGTTVQEQRGKKTLKIQDFLLYEFFHATFVKGQLT